MKKLILIVVVSSALNVVAGPIGASAEHVKVDGSNYQEDEVARDFNKWAAKNANNKLMHMTVVTPSGRAPTVRMNSDSLYSAAIVDPEAAEFFSFTLYDTDGYLMDADTIINSRDMVLNDEGTYTVSINCGDAAINDIPAPAGAETISYARRVHGASEEEENRSWDPIDTMQVVFDYDAIKT